MVSPKPQSPDVNMIPPSEISRVEEFWLKDGNIVLQVESSQFRVHKSVLAMHSSIFKDLFDVPQPEGEYLIEGCQVVHLSDSARDVENILSLLYKGFNHVSEWSSEGNDDPASLIPMVTAMIRLGLKYEFTRLKDEALICLKKLFPNSLEKWSETGVIDLAALFNVINLAHETSITSILPAAYMDVCWNASLENIVLGVNDLDGEPVRLNPHCMERCIIGREKLVHRLPESIFPRVSAYPCKTCTNRPSCKESLTDLMWSAWKQSTQSLSPCGTINCLLPSHWGATICAKCKATIMDHYEKNRRSLWNELPGYFGLPNWHDLEPQDAELAEDQDI